MNNLMRNFMLGSTVLSLGILTGAPAYAQEVAAEEQAFIDDIVVTARRSSESQQSTPVAVTALNAEALTRNQVLQVVDLQRTAPSLSVGSGGTGGPSISYLTIRGQAQNSPNSASDAAVGTYVDGVYYGRPTSGNLGFLDIAQAEVLRGPQGTLFGRNTTGGALNITTALPGEEFAGYLRAGYGNYSATRLEGAVSIPISGDQFGLRLAGRYSARDGYVHNPIRNSDYQDVDHDYALRATMRWAPDNLPVTLVVSADTVDYEDNGGPTAVIGLNLGYQPLLGFPVGPAATFTLGQMFALGNLPLGTNPLNPLNYLVGAGGTGRFDETYQNQTVGPDGSPINGVTIGRQDVRTPFNGAESGGVNANLDIDLGGVSIKSITAYRTADSTNQLDLDGTPLNIIAFVSDYTQEQMSQELQLSTTIGNLDVIAGLFYFQEEGDESSIATSFGNLGFPTRLTLGNFEAESRAAFFQANYHFTESLRGTVGYRYTSDSRSIIKRGRSNIALPGCGTGIPLVPGLGCYAPFSEDFNYPSYTLGLDYRMNDDVFLYARTSAAAMAGGFNTRDVPAGSESFDPEKIRDIEIGAKLDLMDNHLRLNMAIFHAENERVQRIINAFLPGAGLSQYAANAGDTETNGVELEVTALPWEGMELTANVAYLDASYVSGTFIEDRGPNDARLNGNGIVDRSGEDVPYAVELQYAIGATQDFDTSLGLARIHLDYTYLGEKPVNVTTASTLASPSVQAEVAEQNRLGTLPSYGLLNVRASLELAGSGAEIAVWGRNLTDEEYYINTFDGYRSLGFTTANQGAPLTYGVSLEYRF